MRIVAALSLTLLKAVPDGVGGARTLLPSRPSKLLPEHQNVHKGMQPTHSSHFGKTWPCSFETCTIYTVLLASSVLQPLPKPAGPSRAAAFPGHGTKSPAGDSVIHLYSTILIGAQEVYQSASHRSTWQMQGQPKAVVQLATEPAPEGFDLSEAILP